MQLFANYSALFTRVHQTKNKALQQADEGCGKSISTSTEEIRLMVNITMDLQGELLIIKWVHSSKK